MRYISLVILLICSHAAGNENRPAQEILAEFNQTVPFLAPRKNQIELGAELQRHCEIEISACLKLIAKNPALVVAATPDNPVYWQRYDAVLASVPIPIEALDANTSLVWTNQNGALFDSARNRWIRELAMDGKLNLKRVIRDTQRLSQRTTNSLTLIERMINIAALGITHQWVNLAMAQAAETGREEFWPQFAAALRPRTTEELSYRRLLEHEFNYSENLLKEAPETIHEWQQKYSEESEDSSLAQNTPTESELNAERINFERFLADYKILIEKISSFSELPTAAFWDGSQRQELGQVYQELQTGDIPLPPLQDYLHTDRLTNMSFHLLSAAVGIYRGINTTGIPEQAAPANWAWQWREEPGDLCLIPTTATTDIDEICLHIWRSEELADAFRLQ